MWIQVNKIKGYEQFSDCYFINELGQIRNMKLGVDLQINYSRKYPTYRLVPKGIRTTKGVYIHRILAQAFIPNPNNLPMVRHLNDNKLDWRLENLAWGTQQDNESDKLRNFGEYSGVGKNLVKTKCLETGIIYNSACEASRQTKIQRGDICRCCRGERKTAGGYHWKYVEEV